jgi:hypothetical protein
MIFSFGKHSSEHIEIDVLRYEREPIGDYHDDNWLKIKILVVAGGFQGKVAASIMTKELNEFLKSLRVLYKTLQGDAVFKTLEDQLDLKLCGNGKGHVQLIGKILDQAGVGNCLNFKFILDQTELVGSISDLEQVVNTFPVR